MCRNRFRQSIEAGEALAIVYDNFYVMPTKPSMKCPRRVFKQRQAGCCTGEVAALNALGQPKQRDMALRSFANPSVTVVCGFTRKFCSLPEKAGISAACLSQ